MLGNVTFDEIHENTYKLKRDKNFVTSRKQIYFFSIKIFTQRGIYLQILTDVGPYVK